MAIGKKFWLHKTLEEMTVHEREQICDGCARCCLQKLEDIETGQTYFTRIACGLLDIESCRCTDYAHRFKRVADCAQIFPLTAEKRNWLPESCAYLRIERGEDLPDWHCLKSNQSEQVHREGVSIAAWAISEDYVDENLYKELIIDINTM